MGAQALTLTSSWVSSRADSSRQAVLRPREQGIGVRGLRNELEKVRLDLPNIAAGHRDGSLQRWDGLVGSPVW